MTPELIYGTLITLATAAFGFLMHDRQQWINRYDALNSKQELVIGTALKLAESVPDLNKVNLSQTIENERLRKRVEELER